MTVRRSKAPLTKTGHISGWRLWLCLSAVSISIILLSQAHRFDVLASKSLNTQGWLITLETPLSADDQQALENRLLATLGSIQQQDGQHILIRPASKAEIEASLESFASIQAVSSISIYKKPLPEEK